MFKKKKNRRQTANETKEREMESDSATAADLDVHGHKLRGGGRSGVAAYECTWTQVEGRRQEWSCSI